MSDILRVLALKSDKNSRKQKEMNFSKKNFRKKNFRKKMKILQKIAKKRQKTNFLIFL